MPKWLMQVQNGEAGYAVPDDLAFHFIGHGVPNPHEILRFRIINIIFIMYLGSFRHAEMAYAGAKWRSRVRRAQRFGVSFCWAQGAQPTSNFTIPHNKH